MTEKSRPYHRLPHYLNDAPPSRSIHPQRRAEIEAAHVTNSISDREQSDREVRADALDSAVKVLASLPENLRVIMTERDVLLLADTFAHYIASGIPGPARVLPPNTLPPPGLTPKDAA